MDETYGYKQTREPKELQHICRNTTDVDDDDLFHSLESENAEEFSAENMSTSDEVIRPSESFLQIVKTGKNESGPECVMSADDQCIDAGSINNSTADKDKRSGPCEEKVPSSSGSFCEFNVRTSNSLFRSSDVFEEKENNGNDSGNSSVTTIYTRNKIDSTEIKSVARCSRAEVERSHSCTDECPQHSEEIIKYVCLSCYKLACQACITIEHKNCDVTEFIPSLIVKPEFRFEEKCKTFETELDQLDKRLKLNEAKVHLNLKACDKMKVKAKSEFKKQREEIDKYFDHLENDFDRKLWEIENRDKEKMQTIMSNQKRIEQELQRQQIEYDQRKETGNSSRVFTQIEMSRDVIKEIEKDLAAIEKENIVERYKYTPSRSVSDFIKTITELGSIELVDSKTKLTVTDVKEFRMKVTGDLNACKISGLIVLTERHLLAVDCGNSSLKVVDILNNDDVTSIPMSEVPFDVTLVRDDGNMDDEVRANGQVVLTFPKENKLRVMEYTLPDLFTVKRDIETNGKCRGITYSDCKLYVTFPSQGKVEIIDMQGVLVNRITTDTIGQLFQPQFIAIDQNKGTIFISDKENHAVVSMTTKGDVTAVYTDQDLIEPRGVCVNQTGAVFVCSFATHMIYHLSEDCELVSTMRVGDTDTLTPYPFSVVYSDKTHVVYVGLFIKDCIKAYTLSESDGHLT